MNKHLLTTNFALVLTVAFTLIATPNAQQREPAWRVINSADATPVPDYNFEANPFPTVAAPQTTEAEEAIDLEALKRAQDRAAIVAELRQIILAKSAYTPDFNPYTATGYLVGRNGPQALMGGHWVRKGDVITVNITGTERAISLHNRLKELDPKLASSLEKDLNRIVPKGNTIRTTVINIQPDRVTLQDTTGRRYTRPIK